VFISLHYILLLLSSSSSSSSSLHSMEKSIIFSSVWTYNLLHAPCTELCRKFRKLLYASFITGFL